MTSTAEVCSPSLCELIVPRLNDVYDLIQFYLGQPMIASESNGRFKPVFRFTAGGGDMHMHSRLFT